MTDLVVYTITCTCSTTRPEGDLEALAATLPLSPDGVTSSSSPAGVRRGDARPRKARRGGSFGYNMSCAVRVASQERTVHIKLFRTGSLQIAGALTVEAAYSAARLLTAVCGLDDPVDMSVRMINSGFRAGPLDLIKCRDLFRGRDVAVEYDPVRYSAVKVSFFYANSADRAPAKDDGRCPCAVACGKKGRKHRRCDMVTVSIFAGGSVGVSGPSFGTVTRTYEYVRDALGSADVAPRDVLSRLLDMA